ncbi:helix-turn-helix domain-containing protein [Haoranjiania flava]|uniref:Helix-turn-helix domain-containing protein n=1 Tax=Haoranjiania flava TaxID=1856322 RepID=A0AAE3IPL8_9BACT|nr:helix-turn-helix domain-containing protein [Haoranjiania flava]MCU7694806.1 helix-turn-helix domain-containing protein [Haoranjiania flava]
MEQTIFFTPVILSLLTLVFYYITDLKQERFRYIPWILGCFAAEAVYILYLFKVKETQAYMYTIMPPLDMCALVLLFFFLYETITGKRLSMLVKLLNFLPAILWMLAFIAVETAYALILTDTKDHYLGRQITGLIMCATYFLVLLPMYGTKKISKLKNLDFTDALMFLGLLITITLTFSIFFTLFSGASNRLAIYMIKILEFITVITLYLLLFNQYKYKLENMRNKRLAILQPFSIALPKTDAQPAIETEIEALPEKMNDTKYMKVLLDDDTLNYYLKKIQAYFAKELDEYLSPEFNLSVLSEKTGIQKAHLSQVFNVKAGKTFIRFLNEKRIAYACELLQEDADMSIIALSEACGYRSRTTFYQQFKAIKGQSVQEYISNLKINL